MGDSIRHRGGGSPRQKPRLSGHPSADDQCYRRTDSWPVLGVNAVSILRFLLICTLFCVVPSDTAHSETWDIPAELNDKNTSVTFVVDSTWHTVHGTTKDIAGKVRLRDPKDPLSIEVELRVPVKLFDTDSGLRDERLREVMAVEAFPFVRFVSTRLSQDCAPSVVTRDGSCRGMLSGSLTIRDVTTEVSLPTLIRDTANGYRVEGSLAIRWEDFHVEDPSILIAKLDPVVTISYQTTIPKRR
jgi:polyisoprenoid-binding protein YceI